MKICFVVNECSFFYSHRFELAKKLLSLGEIFLITDYINTDKKILEEINSSGIQLKLVKKRTSHKGIIGFIFYLCSLKRAIKVINPSRIFFVTLEISLAGILVSLLNTKIKCFYLVTGFGPFFFKKNLKNRSIYLFYKCIFLYASIKKNSKFIFQNVEDKNIFIQKKLSSKKNSVLIHGSGINTKQIKFKPKNKSDPVSFLFASRLVKAKGTNEYLVASKLLKNIYPEISINMIGKYDVDDPDSISEDLFSKILSSTHVNYLGEIDIDKMADFLHEYTIFVLPSHGEGLPKSALEAAASGMPLILSSASGCKECILEDKNGLLIESMSGDSLKNAMEWMLLNKKKMEEMSHASRDLIESKFSLEKIFVEYKNIIIDQKQV